MGLNEYISYPENNEKLICKCVEPKSPPKLLYILTVTKHPYLVCPCFLIVAGNKLLFYNEMIKFLKEVDNINEPLFFTYNQIASAYRKRPDSILTLFSNENIEYKVKCMVYNGIWYDKKPFVFKKSKDLKKQEYVN